MKRPGAEASVPVLNPQEADPVELTQDIVEVFLGINNIDSSVSANISYKHPTRNHQKKHQIPVI
jgi:ABC-type phosphate transport system ATPase subunit